MEKVPNLICTLWNKSSHWNNSINSNSVKFWNEMTPNLNSSLGIGATAPTPIHQSGEDSNVSLEISWKNWKKDVNQVSLVFFWTSSETWMERGKFKHMESLGIPQFCAIGVAVDPPFLPWSWNWIISKINSKELELECGIVNWPQFFSNYWKIPMKLNIQWGQIF